MLSGTHSTRWWAVLVRLFVLLNVFIAILSKGAQPYGCQNAAAHRKRNRSAVQATPWLCMASVSSAGRGESSGFAFTAGFDDRWDSRDHTMQVGRSATAPLPSQLAS